MSVDSSVEGLSSAVLGCSDEFLSLSCSAGRAAGPSGSLSQGCAACVCEARASPAAAGLQRQRLHDVKAHRQSVWVQTWMSVSIMLCVSL